MKVAWIVWECNFRQRSIVYSRIDKKVKWDIGNRNKAINSFSSTDRWTDNVKATG